MTVVEIEAAVVAAGAFFDHVNGHPLADPRVRLIVNDARAYLERTDRRFDVIVSEPSSVWLTGPSKLFTAETFDRMRARLAPGGIAGQWLSSYDLTAEDLLTVLRTYRSVFANVAVVQLLADADLLLLGSDEPLQVDLPALEAAAADARIRADLDRIGVAPVCGLLDRIVAEPEAVTRNLPAGPLNTDDNALLEYRGARTVGTLGEREALARLAAGARGPGAMLQGRDPRAPFPPAALAVTCLAEGAVRAARSLASIRLESGPDADASWVLGELLRAQAQRPEALDRFAEAVRASPAHARAWISTALTLQELDRLAEAIAAWDRAKQVAPTEPLVPAWRGVARLESGDPAGALGDFREARARSGARSGPIPLDLYEARALQEAGREAEGRPFLERAVAAYAAAGDTAAESVAASERLARILASIPGQRDRAAQLARDAAGNRRRLAVGLLSGALRIESEAGGGAALAYLRGLVRMDPALREALGRSAAQAPGNVRARLAAMLAGLE